ncbi:MAG: hypothetical protein E6713_17570 [Sporomusaceae bacterium]|nr:hypothetical protein [Sporomusaceae bacterium]
MIYCELTDLRDELLKKDATQDDIDEATAYIDDLAESLGVAPTRILSPPPYKVKKLAMAYALMTTASNKSRMNQKGVDGVDAWELKRKVFAAEVDRLTSEIKETPSILTGKKKRSNLFQTIDLVRR